MDRSFRWESAHRPVWFGLFNVSRAGSTGPTVPHYDWVELSRMDSLTYPTAHHALVYFSACFTLVEHPHGLGKAFEFATFLEAESMFYSYFHLSSL